MAEIDWEQRVIELTEIQLQIDEHFVPDVEPSANYAGPHVVATVHAGRLSVLSASGKITREHTSETGIALLREALLARSEKVRLGIDTALGRTLTVLKLRVDHARGPSHSFVCSASINHLMPHALPAHWSALLRIFRDAAEPLGEPTASDWDRALIWAAPVDLGAVFRSGGAMRLPHIVTTIAHDGPLLLRSGQLPQPSRLYRLENGKLTCLDDNRRVELLGRGFALPCGAGTLMMYREWNEPLRVVIRESDSRGIYIQRG